MGTVAMNSGKEFELAPEGNHVGRCYQVVDLGMQDTPWGQKYKIRVAFELPNKLMTEGENNGKPFSVSSNYTLSLSDKANLRKDLESWRGKSFSEDELNGFDIKNVIGKPCMVQVVHNESDGKTYANIASITSLPEGLTCPDQINPSLYFNNDTATDEEFNSLPEWLQKRINRQGKSSGITNSSSPNSDNEFDDDIPF